MRLLTETKALDAVLADIERLQEGAALLEQLYLDIGPYGAGTVTDQTKTRMQRFFNYDDSE